MRILNLTSNSDVYTCNSYLVTGNLNSISDVNTLIDTGRDIKIIDKIFNSSTGVGKKNIEQVIFTHSHYDHAGLIKDIKKNFNPRLYAYSNSLEGVDVILKGEENIKIGDRVFRVIHTPGHSNDSICLYNKEEKVLFSGDVNLIITSLGGSYEKKFLDVLYNLNKLNIEKIYPGHGNPIIKNCNNIIKMTLNNVRQSEII